MMRKLFTILGTLGVIAATVVLLAIMNAMRPEPERQEAAPRLPAAFVEEVSYQPMSLTVAAQGEVQPRRQINLLPQVSGRIVQVSDKFVDGGIISEGDVLVQLEDADYRSALTRARARVAEARQALEIERAEAALAQQDFQELGGLSSNDTPSALTLRQPQLARAEASYNAALADQRDAELALERTRISAPFDGRVRSISADIGQFVNAGQSIGELFSTDIAEIRMPLTDSDLAKLNLPYAFAAEYENGPNVEFSAVAAGQTRSWSGHLVRVAAAIDPTTRQITAIAQVRDPYGEGADDGFPMAIGLFVTAEIEGPLLDRAIALPRVAVTPDSSVFVVNDEDVIEERQVSIAATTSRGVIITDGIREGERVIVSRAPTGVGQKIRPLDPAAPASSKPSSDRSGTTTVAATDTSADQGTN